MGNPTYSPNDALRKRVSVPSWGQTEWGIKILSAVQSRTQQEREDNTGQGHEVETSSNPRERRTRTKVLLRVMVSVNLCVCTSILSYIHANRP